LDNKYLMLYFSASWSQRMFVSKLLLFVWTCLCLVANLWPYWNYVLNIQKPVKILPRNWAKPTWNSKVAAATLR
jgi:hypothetical protein